MVWKMYFFQGDSIKRIASYCGISRSTVYRVLMDGSIMPVVLAVHGGPPPRRWFRKRRREFLAMAYGAI